MSKNRFDRRPRPEEWKSDYAALTGGMDQSSSALAIKPGRVQAAQNWEEVFGKQGYSTIRGYERFDGQARPSAATYQVLRFDTGTAAIPAGTVVGNGAGASATVVSQTIESGAVGTGNAAGYLILCKVTGDFEQGNPIQVTAVTRAVATEDAEVGSIGFSGHETALRATTSYLRGLIDAVPGEGAVLGVAVFGGLVYAVRNAVGGASATLWKSSAAGWTDVQTGLHPGGAWRFREANFTGDSANLYLFGVNGRSRMLRIGTDDSVTKAGAIFGSEASSTSVWTIGAGSKTWTIAESARNYVNGDDLTVWDVQNAANYMRGTVTAYNSGTGALTINVTSTGGAGTISDWEIGRSDFADKPYLLAPYKNHMFWAYPRGQLQTSDLGEPMQATTTAALFGFGTEIADMTNLKGKSLGVFGRKQIGLLTGSSALDFDLPTYSTEKGAVTGSVQDNGGNALFLDSQGLTTLQATQEFGDFASFVISRDAKTYLDARITQVVGSRMATSNYQYRIYFATGEVLRGTLLAGGSNVTPATISFMPSQYAHTPTCFASGVMADDSEDRMFFGTSDGYVMEEDAGTSHDGEAIQYVLRMPFNHFKSPAFIKSFRKLELELEVSNPNVAIYFRQLFEYDDTTYNFGFGSLATEGIGGQFDVSAWDTFQFDQPLVSRAETSIDGQGRNMALLLFFDSDFYNPVVLQGILTYFVQLGMQR